MREGSQQEVGFTRSDKEVQCLMFRCDLLSPFSSSFLFCCGEDSVGGYLFVCFCLVS